MHNASIYNVLFFFHCDYELLYILGILAFGVKESAVVNKVFTAVNILVLLFVILSGVIKGDVNNWYLDETSLSDQYEYGPLYFFTMRYSGINTWAFELHTVLRK